MNAVKTVKMVRRTSKKAPIIRELRGSNKMAFIIDSAMKRQIVFKPV